MVTALAVWRWPFLLALACTLGSCSQVVETKAIGYATENQTGNPLNCSSRLGSYNLPKTFLRIQIARVSTSQEYVLHTISQVVRSDNARAFCLDYLASSFSDDQVRVKKSKDSGGTQFLQVISSEVVDQTSLILRRFIRTAFIAISNLGARSLKKDEKVEELIDIEYDPFDIEQTAQINSRVREYGFCLVLENFSFSTHTSTAQKYCRNPTAVAHKSEQYARWYTDYKTADVRPTYPGIVYRPRAAYQLRIYTKNDPQGLEPWLVRKTELFYFENISPILSVRVDRTTFAHRKAVLMFDNGALTDVCISKTSEMEEAIEIPLDIAKAIVRLPTQIIQIQYDQIADSNSFLDAEKRLVTAQQRLIDAMQTNNPEGGSMTRPGDIPSPVQTIAIPEDLATPKSTLSANFPTCTPASKRT